MKLLPILLINVVTVAAGLVVYEQVRTDAPAAAQEALTADFVTEADLERALERVARPAPMLSAKGGEARLAERLAALERRLAAPQEARPDPVLAAEESRAEGGPLATPALPGEEPSDLEVARMKKVMAKAEAERRADRAVARLDRTLERLEITLNPAQKKKTIAATTAYGSKVGSVWRAAFTGGTSREEGMDTARKAMEGLRQELTTELTEFMPGADAQKLTESMGGGMRGGFGRGR